MRSFKDRIIAATPEIIRPARKDQVARLVAAYENQDKGMETSNTAERVAANRVRRVEQNSTLHELTVARTAYKQKHGYSVRYGTPS